MSDKIQLGVNRSSDLQVDDYDADPANFPAGSAVRMNSSGELSTAVGDGSLMGVSLGQSLSDTKATAVANSGLLVPVMILPYDSETPLNDVDFQSAIDDANEWLVLGDYVAIDDATGLASDPANIGDGAFESNAVWRAAAVEGRDESGNRCVAALCDMPGGL